MMKRFSAAFMTCIYLSSSVTTSCGRPLDAEEYGRSEQALETGLLVPFLGVGPTTILPTDASNGVGARLEGVGSVTKDGAASYTIPLWTPPGRAGIEPRLALSYNSHSGNGLLGQGFTLSGLSQIRRCTKTIARDGKFSGIQYNAQTYCLDGIRLVPVPGVAREFRTEVDTFSKITIVGGSADQPTMFEVRHRDGTIATYGDVVRGAVNYNVPGPAILDYGGGLAWGLAKVTDRSGNFLAIRYAQENGNDWRPLEIAYTGFNGTPVRAATKRVVFEYEERPDILATHQNLATTRLRMRAVRAFGPTPIDEGLLREYRFAYEAGTSGASRLAIVTECDGAGVCKRPSTFSWSNERDDFEHVALPPDAAAAMSGTSRSLAVGDLNGDGLGDLVFAEAQTNVAWNIKVSMGSSGGFSSSTVASSVMYQCGGAPTVTVTDLDRDGLDDLVIEDCGHDGSTLYYYLSQVVSGVHSFRWLGADERVERSRPLIADLNGDKFPDVAFAVEFDAGFQQLKYRINQRGELGLSNAARTASKRFAPATSFLAIDWWGNGSVALVGSVAPTSTSGRRTLETFTLGSEGERFAWTGLSYDVASEPSPLVWDANGDGKPEGLKYSTDLGLSESCFKDGHDKRLLDYSGDGRADIVIVSKRCVEVGGAFTDDQMQVLETLPTGGFVRRAIEVPPSDTPASSQVMDVNGDGLLDIITEKGLFRRRGRNGNVVTQVVDGQGYVENFEYAPVTDSNVYLRASEVKYPQLPVVSGMWVVQRHRRDDGVGGERSRRYVYSDGRMDIEAGGFIGFGELREVDEQTGSEAATTFDNRTRTGGLYLRAALPTVETLVENISESPPKNITTQRHYTYSLVEPDDGTWAGKPLRPRFVYASEVLQEVSENAATIGRIKTEVVLDSRGRPTLQWVTRTDIKTGKESSDGTTILYDRDDLITWLLGRESRRIEFSRDKSGKTSERVKEFDYYEASGLLKTVRIEPDREFLDRSTAAVASRLWQSVEIERSTEGLVTAVVRTSTRDAIGACPPNERLCNKALAELEVRREEVEYDSVEAAFPVLQRNAEGHEVRFAYHRGLGVLAAVEDANKVRTYLSYDGFGRARSENGPTLADTTISYRDWFECPFPDSPRGVCQVVGSLVTQRQVGGQEVGSRYDKLGREIERFWRSFDGSRAVAEQVYDSLGRVQKVIRSGDGAVRVVSSGYDLLGRRTSVTNPDGTKKSWEYSGLQTTIFDENEPGSQRERRLLGNEQGLLESSSDVDASGRLLTTQYVYGPFGQLEEVQTPSGKITKFLFDELGRRKQVVDPDSGTRQYAYNGFGEMTRSVDAEGNVTNSQLDKLGRTISSKSKDGVTSWTWDSAKFGVGALASTSSPDGVTTAHLYDSMGRPRQVAWGINGETFPVTTHYDEYGRVNAVEYPEGPPGEHFMLGYSYTPWGHAESVSDFFSSTVYWKRSKLDAFSDEEVLGNGVRTTRRFDSRGSLRFIGSQRNGAPIQKLAYQYKPNGALASQSDMLARSTEDFEYDSLDRLSRWTHVQNCQRSEIAYSYNDDGNQLAREVLQGPLAPAGYRYGENGSGPNALTSITTGASYSYDSNGNQRSGDGRTVGDYTSFDLPSSITSAGRSYGFQYDAFQQRVRKASGGDETVYAGGLYERRIKALEKTHVYSVRLGDRVIAEVHRKAAPGGGSASATLYLHEDRLGSVETVTDGVGAVVQRNKYQPFGARRYPYSAEEMSSPVPSATRRGFTGHEMDDELGLINMKGRMYDAKVARFMSTDPVVSDASFGQAFNPYSYVANNPLRYVDPSGFVFGIDDLLFWGAVAAVAIGTYYSASTAGQVQVGFGGTFGADFAPSSTSTGGVSSSGGGATYGGLWVSTSVTYGGVGSSTAAAGSQGSPAPTMKTADDAGVGASVQAPQGPIGSLGNPDLAFDGRTLVLYENGEPRRHWSAYSGRPGYMDPKFQNDAWKGPIPEGFYWVQQRNLQELRPDVGTVLKGLVGRGTWPGLWKSWGNYRIWLEPLGGTELYDRNGFSIHGGSLPGSAGCIDLCFEMDGFVDMFRRLGRDLLLRVQYR